MLSRTCITHAGSMHVRNVCGAIANTGSAGCRGVTTARDRNGNIVGRFSSALPSGTIAAGPSESFRRGTLAVTTPNQHPVLDGIRTVCLA